MSAVTQQPTPLPPSESPRPAREVIADLDAAVVGAPRGFSASAYVTRKAAEAQERLDALAAAGKPSVPKHQRLPSAADIRQRALDEAMDAEYQRMTLEAFTAYSIDLRGVVSCLAGFIERPRGMLYLWGQAGIGKTHLAVGAAIRLVERGFVVRVRRAADIAQKLRELVSDYSELGRYKDRLMNVRVLVIDDFGAEHMTEFLAAEWFSILEYRHRQYAATIITSNMAPESLNMPRLASRFRDEDGAMAIGIPAEDYRRLRALPDGPVADAFAPPSEMATDCATCGGTGAVRLSLPIGHPHFGKSHTCPTCKGALAPMRAGGAA